MQPLPPGCAQTLWNDHPRYLDAYLNTHPGYYHTGDGGYLDADGFVYIMGRTDDVINVSGHRLSERPIVVVCQQLLLVMPAQEAREAQPRVAAGRRQLGRARSRPTPRAPSASSAGRIKLRHEIRLRRTGQGCTRQASTGATRSTCAPIGCV